MRLFNAVVLAIFVGMSLYAQSDLQQLLAAEDAFDHAATERGIKAAFLEFLADDSIVFRPDAVNGREFWSSQGDSSNAVLIRRIAFADIAANGMLGYTTGSWELRPKGKPDSSIEFGQFVTIWERKADGIFRANLDISVAHEKLEPAQWKRIVAANEEDRDLNKRGWSPADASMDFFRMSMAREGLGGAYRQFAADDVRLLREREPPIIGKKRVVSQMKNYFAVEFPKRVALYLSADMAYTWNPCEFANSAEGFERGNCLHIWKLRNRKWWIVLGVFAPLPNDTIPTLKVKPKRPKPVKAGQ